MTEENKKGWFKKITGSIFGSTEKKSNESTPEKTAEVIDPIPNLVVQPEKTIPEEVVVDLVEKIEQPKELEKDEVGTETNSTEGEKKGWFSKVVDTLNAPIEIKIETPEGDASWISKLKGNVSIGLGKPEVKETVEDREKWKEQLEKSLTGTRKSFLEKIERLVKGRSKIDADLLEEIEEILLESDVGVHMTDNISQKLKDLAKENRFLPEEVMPALFEYLREQLDKEQSRIVVDESRLNIIMMVGVNGTGKTTTTGKIAAKLKINDYSVILGAADTFRAAAIEQLDIWSKRAGVPIVKHQEGSDPAAVVFDAIKSAQAKNVNVLIIDTAGRLHNKTNLMEELRKIRRIIDREAPEAKLEVILVLDATTGQNGVKQAKVFGEAVQLTGVALTKLDGTAKGGVVFSIKDSLNIPIKLVGVGEGVEDLRDFDPQLFIEALFSHKLDKKIAESTKTVIKE